jgi:hypothetical protein
MEHSWKNKIPRRRKQTIGEANEARQEGRERKSARRQAMKIMKENDKSTTRPKG